MWPNLDDLRNQINNVCMHACMYSKKHVDEGVQFPDEYEFIEKHGDYEYWWNVPDQNFNKIGS